jgi:hypothetical protein
LQEKEEFRLQVCGQGGALGIIVSVGFVGRLADPAHPNPVMEEIMPA